MKCSHLNCTGQHKQLKLLRIIYTNVNRKKCIMSLVWRVCYHVAIVFPEWAVSFKYIAFMFTMVCGDAFVRPVVGQPENTQADTVTVYSN